MHVQIKKIYITHVECTVDVENLLTYQKLLAIFGFEKFRLKS